MQIPSEVEGEQPGQGTQREVWRKSLPHIIPGSGVSQASASWPGEPKGPLRVSFPGLGSLYPSRPTSPQLCPSPACPGRRLPLRGLPGFCFPHLVPSTACPSSRASTNPPSSRADAGFGQRGRDNTKSSRGPGWQPPMYVAGRAEEKVKGERIPSKDQGWPP